MKRNKTNAKIPPIKKPEYRFDYKPRTAWIADQVKENVEFCEKNINFLTKIDIIKTFKKLVQ